MKSTKKAGFTSVFIVIILSSIIALITIFIKISLERAGDSIASCVTTNAGASVLNECNRDLYDKFGILALVNDPARLSDFAYYYISESIDGINRFVHLQLDSVFVDTGKSNDYYLDDFRAQLVSIGKKNLIFRNNKTDGLLSFTASNLPSKSVVSSSFLDPYKIISLINGHRKVGDGIFITQYIFSNFTIAEIEYLLFGCQSCTENSNACRNTIFTVRSIINCISEIEDPILLIEAIARAWRETDEIMNDEALLLKYLQSMVFILSSSDLLILRVMDIMQMSISGNFNFKNYAYKFTLTAQFSLNNKHAVYVQAHGRS